jgi:MFS transporter, ACS family, glucarate transporter
MDRASSIATQVRWRILAVMVWAALVSYLLRGNLSIAAPAMMAELKFSEVQWGWVMAAFPLGYALFQFPGGLWVGRVGPRRALVSISVAWSALLLISCLLPNRPETEHGVASGAILLSLIVLQFLVGVAHAPVFTAIATGIERWFPVGRWALPNGLASAGLTVGLAATASLLPWLISELQWRVAFAVLAPAGLLSAGLCYLLMRDSPKLHASVNQAERDHIELGRAQAQLAQSAPDPRELMTGSSLNRALWFRVLKDRNVLLITLSYACMNFVFYVVFSWGYYYLVNVRGFAAQAAGFLTTLQWLGAGVGAIIGGMVCDHLCRKIGSRWGYRVTICIGMLGSALLLLGVAFHPNAMVAAILLGFCFFLNQSSEGPFWGMCTAIGGRYAGACTGLMNTGANLMGFVNALLLSSIAHRIGWANAIAISAVFALLSAGLILLVRADQMIDQQA